MTGEIGTPRFQPGGMGSPSRARDRFESSDLDVGALTECFPFCSRILEACSLVSVASTDRKIGLSRVGCSGRGGSRGVPQAGADMDADKVYRTSTPGTSQPQSEGFGASSKLRERYMYGRRLPVAYVQHDGSPFNFNEIMMLSASKADYPQPGAGA